MMQLTHSVYNLSVQLLKNAMPAIVGSAIQTGLQDPRIGKIIGGLGLIASGITTIVGSGVSKSIKRWIHFNKRTPVLAEEPSSKCLQWWVATAGLVATSYGIYNVAIGAFELFTRQITSELKPDVPDLPFSAFYLKNGTETTEIRRNARRIAFKEREGIYEGYMSVRYDADCTGRCMDYVERKTGAIVDLYDHLPSIEGYEIVETAKENDIIIYFDTTIDFKQTSPLTHVGFISKIENAKTWVASKWGLGRCFNHLEEVVPERYGNAVVYLRKK